MIRAVLDANVIISGTIAPKGPSAAILNAWRAEYLEVVTCPAILDEIAEKLRLPRIRKRYPVSDADVVNLLLRFGQSARMVPGRAPVTPPPPDPDDTMLFAAAIESGADYLITGDKALLEFGWPGPGRILNPRDFWEREFPRHLAVVLTYPVIVLEDLSTRRACSVDVEGQTCLALFTTPQTAELYCQKNKVLAETRLLHEREHLIDYLRAVLTSGCEWVAFNPIGEDCIYQPITVTLETLEQGVKPS